MISLTGYSKPYKRLPQKLLLLLHRNLNQLLQLHLVKHRRTHKTTTQDDRHKPRERRSISKLFHKRYLRLRQMKRNVQDLSRLLNRQRFVGPISQPAQGPCTGMVMISLVVQEAFSIVWVLGTVNHMVTSPTTKVETTTSSSELTALPMVINHRRICL